MITAVLIFLPLIAGLLLFLLNNKEQVKHLALTAALVEFAISVYAFATFKTGNFTFNTDWIPSLGISFSVGMDGISILLVMLTTFLVPLIILSSYNHSYNKSNQFYALVLIMQSALVGVFVAKDAFLFYIFWELALIPIYFISLLWGGEDRRRITFKFFIYTLAGSLFMLLGIIYLYLKVDSFDISAFYQAAANLSRTEQTWLFWAFFLAFAIKMPVFPFHTWQPETYTSAPAQGTMLLSGIMLKMGIYGVIRFILPIVPMGVIEWGPIAIILCVTGIIYASIIAIKQKDFKTLVAYVSIAHVGLIAAGVFTQTVEGLQGAMIQMLSHGIVAVGLFYIIDIIFERTKTRDIASLGGLRSVAPLLAVFYLIIMMASIA
ncbi:MAG TPA: NADH-quinone oxidoreductase subunit M, partial [Cytophagaceae bacterium]